MGVGNTFFIKPIKPWVKHPNFPDNVLNKLSV